MSANSRNYHYLFLSDAAVQFLGYPKKVDFVLMESDEGKHVVVLEVV